MNIQLTQLHLVYFKGIKEFTLQVASQGVGVYGDNAVGKTTLFDAFTWCLFGKDSLGRTDFEIKTLDTSGGPFPGLDHTVEATLNVDGRPIVFRRTLREKYKKPKGAKEEQFTGHETLYAVDDQPMKEMDYQLAVKGLMPESIFRMVTSARWFNENQIWQDRRRALLVMCGDVPDETVFQAEPELAPLKEVWPKGKSAQDWRAALMARRADLNKELTALPIRIDEATKAMPQVPDIPLEGLDEALTQAGARATELKDRRAEVAAGGGAAAKAVELHTLEGKILAARNAGQAESGKQVQALRQKRERLAMKQDQIQASKRSMERVVEQNTREIEANTPTLEGLRKSWQDQNAAEWVWDGQETCPTCRQRLPQGQIQEARKKAEADFNKRKSQSLDATMAQGKQLASRVEAMRQETAAKQEAIAQYQKELDEVLGQLNELDAEFDRVTAPAAEVPDTPEIKALITAHAKLEGEVALLRADNELALVGVDDQIKAADAAVGRLMAARAVYQQRESLTKRIETLEAEHQGISASFDQTDRNLYLVDLFTKTKTQMLEVHINSKFRVVRWKLFEVGVNGAVQECCEATVDGVPYGSMNNAARINAGLDIINALAAYHKVTAPVFIDNAEAVVQLVPTVGQQVRLYVSPGDTMLKVVPLEAQ